VQNTDSYLRKIGGRACACFWVTESFHSGDILDLLFHMLDVFTLAYCSSDSSAQHSVRDYSRERKKNQEISLKDCLKTTEICGQCPWEEYIREATLGEHEPARLYRNEIHHLVGNHSNQTARHFATAALAELRKGTKCHLAFWFSTKRGHRLHRRMDKFASSSEGISCLNLESIIDSA
jgi:hypothetical protein